MIKKLFVIAGITAGVSIVCLAGAFALAGQEITTKGYSISVVEDGDHIRFRKGDAAKPTPQVTRTIAWTGSDFLSSDLDADVEYVQGAEASIRITGPQALVDAIRFDNGKLWMLDAPSIPDSVNFTIGKDGIDAQSNKEGLRIVVTAPSVTRFQVLGSGVLDIHNYDQPKIDVEVHSSGSFHGSGVTQVATINVSGSGEADLEDLRAKDATVRLSGSGGTDIHASGKVKVDLSGSGNVELKTKPESLESNISGSGSLHQD
jgi:hypothetical protein